MSGKKLFEISPFAESATHVAARVQGNKGDKANQTIEAVSSSKSPSMMPKFLLLVLPSLLFSACLAGDEQPPHFDESYLMGMRAYTREDWAVATAGMQQAVRDFESYNEASLKCLKLCENQKVRERNLKDS